MIYESRHPDVLAAWMAYEVDRERHAIAVRAMVPPAETPGFTPDVMGSSYWLRTGAHEVIGWTWPWNAPVPAGWKRDRKAGVIMPRASKAPADRAARDSLPPPLAGLILPGMESSRWEGFAMVKHGVRLRDDGAVEVDWGRHDATYDPDIWQPVTLVVFS